MLYDSNDYNNKQASCSDKCLQFNTQEAEAKRLNCKPALTIEQEHKLISKRINIH